MVGPGFLQTCAVIGTASVARDTELADRLLHPRGFLVADTDNLAVRMFGGHSQQVAHVKVIEVDAGDAPGFGFHAKAYNRPARQNRVGTGRSATTEQRGRIV